MGVEEGVVTGPARDVSLLPGAGSVARTVGRLYARVNEADDASTDGKRVTIAEESTPLVIKRDYDSTAAPPRRRSAPYISLHQSLPLATRPCQHRCQPLNLNLLNLNLEYQSDSIHRPTAVFRRPSSRRGVSFSEQFYT